MSETQEADVGTPAGVHRRWMLELQEAESWCGSWRQRARRVLKRYRDERPEGDTGRRLNILWSNVSTLQPALYARKPKPVVERKFRDPDPVGRVAATILERATAAAIEGEQFDRLMRAARDDYLLVGRGTAWVRYVPHFVAGPRMPADGLGIADAAESHAAGEHEGVAPEAAELLDYETVEFDHVHWKDFVHQPARSWEEVGWVGRLVLMDRGELVRRFGVLGKRVELDAKPATDEAESEAGRARQALYSRARVWEVWDKRKRQVLWLAKGFDEGPLDVRADPLRLQGFFPCPRPLYATCTTDSLLPIPDYVLYQDQAAELDDLTARIGKLVDACRVAGLYDGSQDSTIGRLLSGSADNTLLPVSTWGSFAAAGGIKGAVDFMPLDQVVNALGVLQQARTQVKADLYEITGISDIIRGYSSPNETATAQQIKGQFAALRLDDRKQEVARFARDLVAIAAEIIAEHFQPRTIALMSGVAEQDPQTQQAFPLALELLRSDAMRHFRVDIETDSTIAVDEAGDKQAAQELVGVVGTLIKEGIGAVAQAPELAPMIGQLLLFVVRRFRAGRQLEGAIEQAMNAIGQRLQQQAQNPPPNPVAEKAKAEIEGGRMRLQADLQEQAQRLQADLAAQQAETQAKIGLRQAEAQAAAQLRAQQAAASRYPADYSGWPVV